MKKILLITVLAFVLFGCRAETIGISKITVLDANFTQLHVIEQPDLISQLNELWKDFEPIGELPNTNWTHKLDIVSERLDGRWLYNQEGFLAKLNKQLKPRFKINNKKAFNKIVLGF